MNRTSITKPIDITRPRGGFYEEGNFARNGVEVVQGRGMRVQKVKQIDVTMHYLAEQRIGNSVNLGSRTLTDSFKLKPILEFIGESNFKIQLKRETEEGSLETLIKFLEDTDYEAYLGRIEHIYIGCVNKTNNVQIQHVINLVSEKCYNLTSLSCGDSFEGVRLELPEKLNMLKVFSCGHIWDGATIRFSESLDMMKSFSCRDVWAGADLGLPGVLSRLESISFGEVRNEGILMQLKGFKEECERKRSLILFNEV